MARINKKVKIFIVKMLAEFETTTDTAKAVKDIFNVDVSQQQCECYDPTKKMGHDLSQELKDLFYKYRRAANDEIEAIPIANKRYRLQKLQSLVDKFGDNPVFMPKFLEQAAKEVGNQYTNKQEITGADGGPLQSENVTYVDASPELIKQVLDELESKY